MIDSTRLGAITDQGSAGTLQLVVEADAGGQAKEALKYALSEPGQSTVSVTFEREETLEVNKIDSMRWRTGAR